MIKKNGNVAEIIESARKFCRVAETFNGNDNSEILSISISLLYHFNLLSQNCFSNETDLTVSSQPTLLSNIPDKDFYVIFDPLDSGSVCATSLKDSLEDIYNDIKPGLEVIESSEEQKVAVLQDWQISFQTHWNRHLIDAIRFLMLK